MDEQMMRETLGEQEPESFEELIAGRYHGDFTRKVQQLMDRRFAEHRQKEEQWAQWLPAVEKLCADRGLDPADAEGLTALLEKEAGARERREALREWAACQTMRQWLEEASGLGERYPGFDLREAMQEEDFTGLLRRGLTVEQAWSLAHRDELMLAAMEATAAHVREMTARSLMQRQARPREGGMLERGAAPTRPSMRETSRSQREELERRALRGERIVI